MPCLSFITLSGYSNGSGRKTQDGQYQNEILFRRSDDVDYMKRQEERMKLTAERKRKREGPIEGKENATPKPKQQKQVS